MSVAREVAAGGLVATLAPQLGGRVSGLAYDGIELLWTDPTRRGGPSAPFALPGGDKVWLAPQSDWPNARPFAALDLGAWAWHAAASEMRSPVEPLLGIRLVRRVEAADGGLLVQTRIEGTPRRPVGLWQVTQLRLPGLARLPAVLEPTGEARDFAADPRPGTGGATEVACDGRGPWKLSSGAEPCAWVEAEVGGVRLRREIVDGTPGRGEVYDSEGLGYWELELHSPIGVHIHTERWTAEALNG